MVWPTTPVSTGNLDAGTDGPAAARAELLQLTQQVNQLQAHVSAFAATLLDDADAAAARATLGGTVVGSGVFTAADAAAARATLGALDASNAVVLSAGATQTINRATIFNAPVSVQGAVPLLHLSGGGVTQSGSKSSPVTLDKVCGVVTSHNEALGAGSSVQFDVNNSTVTVDSVVLVSVRSSANYSAVATHVRAGAFAIRLTNHTGGALSAFVSMNFLVLRISGS